MIRILASRFFGVGVSGQWSVVSGQRAGTTGWHSVPGSQRRRPKQSPIIMAFRYGAETQQQLPISKGGHARQRELIRGPITASWYGLGMVQHYVVTETRMGGLLERRTTSGSMLPIEAKLAIHAAKIQINLARGRKPAMLFARAAGSGQVDWVNYVDNNGSMHEKGEGRRRKGEGGKCRGGMSGESGCTLPLLHIQHTVQSRVKSECQV
jgi:hypothetical protein